MTATIPTPLPPHSQKLRDGRWQVDVSSPHPTRPGSHLVHTTARFVTLRGAVAWSEASRKAGDKANLIRYSKHNGWVSISGPTLGDDGWYVLVRDDQGWQRQPWSLEEKTS